MPGRGQIHDGKRGDGPEQQEKKTFGRESWIALHATQ
jgi:hypothetical protein